MKYLSLSALLFSGCAFESPVLDAQHERSGFVITKPPMQVSFRGDVTEETRIFALDMVDKMKDVEHIDYRFNENHNVRLNSIDGKSDSVNINLHESTTNEVAKEVATEGMIP